MAADVRLTSVRGPSLVAERAARRCDGAAAQFHCSAVDMPQLR